MHFKDIKPEIEFSANSTIFQNDTISAFGQQLMFPQDILSTNRYREPSFKL